MTTSQLTPAGKLTLWALGLLVVSLLVHGQEVTTSGLLDRSGRLKASDYMRLYVTGSLADQGRWSELFDATAHVTTAKARVDRRVEMQGLHPNYGPTAAWLLAPLSRLPFLQSWSLLAALSSAAFLIGIWVLGGQTLALRPYRGLLVLAAAASPALFETIRFGQLSAVTTTLFVVAVLFDGSRRPVLSGVVLGLAFYKPNLVLPAAAIWLLGRQWGLLGGLCLGAIGHVAIGILVAGPDATVAWFDVLARLARDPQAVQGFPEEVHSIQGFWRLLGAHGLTLRFLSLSCSVIGLGLAYRCWRGDADLERRWAALIVTTVLVSPHLLTYDLLLLVPAAFLAAAAWIRSGDGGMVRWCLLGALYFAPVASPLVARLSGVQVSTLVMLMVLGLLGWRSGDVRTSSSISPSISS